MATDLCTCPAYGVAHAPAWHGTEQRPEVRRG